MRSSRSNTVTVWPALLSCAAQASPAGPEPTTATFLPVRLTRRLGDDPPLLEALVDDRALDALDRDRRLADAEHARALARRRADPPGELGEVVGLVQARQRLAPLPAVDEVVPLGDEVVDRAARGPARQHRPRVAEGDAAIHAARPLLLAASSRAGGRGTPSSRARASCGSRPGGSRRSNSMKPVSLPMALLTSHRGARRRVEFSSKAAISASSCDRPWLAHLLLRLEHALVVVRHHAHEERHQLLPGGEDLLRRACCRSAARAGR